VAAKKAEALVEEDSKVREVEMESLATAQEVQLDFRKSSVEATELDYGLHPHGEKWWRYRYEHAFIEAWIMIFISLLMLFWRRSVQRLKAVLDQWALPHGSPPKTEMELDPGYKPGRDDGSLWLVWFSGLCEMMLTCILSFVTVWVVCKTPLPDKLPYWFRAGHHANEDHMSLLMLGSSESDVDMHLPTTGEQYRNLAIDLSSIYFFALLFYFVVMSFAAHQARRVTHKLAKQYMNSPRTPRSADRRDKDRGMSMDHAMSTAAKASAQVMGKGVADFTKAESWFVRSMPSDLARRDTEEARELSALVKDEWEDFPLSKYLIMNVHSNMSSAFSFGWRLWCPIILCFCFFAFCHWFFSAGYVRLMGLFSAFAFCLIALIGWYTKSISSIFDQDVNEIEDKYAAKWHNNINTEQWVIKTLQFTLFFEHYGVCRMICQSWMWELHFTVVLWLTIAAIILSIAFIVLVAPALPTFCAVMALPPYVNNRNIQLMIYAKKHEQDGTDA